MMKPVFSPDAVASPCIGICKLDAGGSYCTGCLRTRAEIGRWSAADTAEKLLILERVKARAGRLSPR